MKLFFQQQLYLAVSLLWSKTNESAAVAGRVPFVLFPAAPDTEAYLGVTVIICTVSIDIWNLDLILNHKAWFFDWFCHPVHLFRSAHRCKVTVI
jgi:hypothetical protein